MLGGRNHERRDASHRPRAMEHRRLVRRHEADDPAVELGNQPQCARVQALETGEPPGDVGGLRRVAEHREQIGERRGVRLLRSPELHDAGGHAPTHDASLVQVAVPRPLALLPAAGIA